MNEIITVTTREGVSVSIFTKHITHITHSQYGEIIFLSDGKKIETKYTKELLADMLGIKKQNSN